MSKAVNTTNPLISTKSSDSSLTVLLHPLVLLTISDHITRHRVRKQEGPIVGALLGQQKGRETTVEHAFQCKPVVKDGDVILDEAWFNDRLQLCTASLLALDRASAKTNILLDKDVHKIPALDLVGWYTLCPEAGPSPALLPIHKQITRRYNESALFLAFHPSAITSSTSININAKLPLTTYETELETEQVKLEGAMQVDGEESMALKFRPIPYSIETDETEMIAIDYVAKGAGGAVAVESGGEAAHAEGQEKREPKGTKRAGKESDEQLNGTDKDVGLSVEEEDQIAGITTRLNCVRMLHSRLSLLSRYLESQSSSYLTDTKAPLTSTSPHPGHLPHLRNIQALLTRLSLLTPLQDSTTINSKSNTLTQAIESQANDVTLTTLLATLGQDIQGLSELGRKFNSIDQAKMLKGKGKGGHGPSTFSGGPEFDLAMGRGGMMV